VTAVGVGGCGPLAPFACVPSAHASAAGDAAAVADGVVVAVAVVTAGAA
jgi:hypothetical protein